MTLYVKDLTQFFIENINVSDNGKTLIYIHRVLDIPARDWNFATLFLPNKDKIDPLYDIIRQAYPPT
nr:hypothetical protein [Microctonus hyperodae filamentous virus]